MNIKYHLHLIQIQHLLKLNDRSVNNFILQVDSNTTFVKVKFKIFALMQFYETYSNTTFVKVKYNTFKRVKIFLSVIQIQHLLKLNKKLLLRAFNSE